MNLDLYKNCKQCPRSCGANRLEGKSGFCKENSSLRAAFAGLHFGEEPLVTVFGGSGTIFITGCTLRCAFCQNYQISQNGFGAEVSSELFTKMCLDLQNKGAENINIVTGSHHIPLLAQFIKDAKNNGVTIPFCWNSSAYESVESLELLKGLVTIWLPDLKTLDKEISTKLFAAPDYPEVCTKAIEWMIKNNPIKIEEVKKGSETKEKLMQGVIIRHLFLPGKFEQTADVLSWLKENADTKAFISLMNQYTPVPFAEDKTSLKKRMDSLSVIENRLVSQTEDMDLQDLIEAFDFDYLFYQELSDDTSWLPDFNNKMPFPNKLSVGTWHWKDK
ncbi:MAG: radical SAM protein [Treponema sp.]|nr:radical SAM protein [Treponema sp.]